MEGLVKKGSFMGNYWKGRRVLVTGFEGFLGSNLTKRLLVGGARVVGLDIRVNRKDTIITKDEIRKIKIIKGDVKDYKLVKKIIQDYRVEAVFHLAAEAIVDRAFKNPLNTFSSNINGTWSLLEACRQTKLPKAIIIASSDKAYGSHEILPYKEEAHLCGRHPYDVSKSCADLITVAYHHTYGLPAVITRCGNIYGSGDFNFSRIVPDAIRSAILDKPLFIRSDGKFTRDYVYVDDIANGYMLLAQKIQSLKLSGQAFNFSNDRPITVIELVKKIYQIVGRKSNFIVLNQAKYEIKHQYLCSQKARRLLGWKPNLNLEEGLRETVAWYRDYSNKQ